MGREGGRKGVSATRGEGEREWREVQKDSREEGRRGRFVRVFTMHHFMSTHLVVCSH